MMVLTSTTGDPFLNDATELAPEDDAFELVTSHGKGVALDVRRDELKQAASPELRDHWTDVKALVAAEPDDGGEQPTLSEPDDDDRQLALFG